MHPPAEHPNAGVPCLLHHRVCSLGYVGEILLGKRHCAVIERDQIPRHLTTPFSGLLGTRISAWRRKRAQWRLTNHRGLTERYKNGAGGRASYSSEPIRLVGTETVRTGTEPSKSLTRFADFGV